MCREKRLIFIVILSCLSLILFCQELNGVSWNTRTKKIEESLDTSFRVKSINIFPTFVEWRFYPDWNYRTRISEGENSKYLKRIKDSSYILIPGLEQFYANKVMGELKSTLRLYDIKQKRVFLMEKDSIFLYKELEKIRQQFTDSIYDGYTMNENLYNFFKKFPADQQIVYDLKVTHEDTRINRAKDLVGYQRFYVFDMKTKKIFFYKYDKYRIYGDEVYYWCPVPHDRHSASFLWDDFPKPQRVYKRYFKRLKKICCEVSSTK
jgi:hypothetical protein